MGCGKGNEVGEYLAVSDYHTVGETVIHDCNFKTILVVLYCVKLEISLLTCLLIPFEVLQF